MNKVSVEIELMGTRFSFRRSPAKADDVIFTNGTAMDAKDLRHVVDDFLNQARPLEAKGNMDYFFVALSR